MKRLLSILLSVTMIVCILPVPLANAATAVKTQNEAVSWLNSQNGASYNFGDFYDDEGNLWGGTQCVEFVKAYVNWLVNGDAWNDTWNGPTYDGSNIWENPIWNRLGWTVYTNTADFLPQPGDIFSSGLYHYGGSACHTGVVISSDLNNAVIADANARNSDPYDGDSVWVHSITWRSSSSDKAYGATHYIRPKFASSVTIYHLDVNVNSDGYSFNSGHSAVTFDVYINGSRVKDDVADYVADLAEGTTYNITDIKVSGCSVNNGTNSYSGTLNGDVTVVIPIVTSHSWNGGTVTTQPTYLTSGVKSYSCTNCGETKTESIDRLALPSSPESVASVESNGHTYTLYAASMSWTAAKTWCENNCGHLVTITNTEEQTLVSDLIGNNSESSFWFGANNISTGSYRWVTGEEWNYTNWAEGEPNNDGTGENYLGSAYHKTEWSDFSETASNVRGFIFETGDEYAQHLWDNGVYQPVAGYPENSVVLYTCDLCGAQKHEYVVSYNTRGGIGTPVQQMKQEDVDLTLSSVQPAKEGYTFIGWSTSPDSVIVDYKSGSVYSEDAPVTLYALYRSDSAVVLWGDATGDGKLSYSDYVKIYQYIRGVVTMTQEQMVLSDVDLSGIVDDADLELLQTYLKNELSEFPAEKLALFSFTAPVKTTYDLGEELDTAGMRITVTNKNNSAISYTIDETIVLSGYDMDQVGEQTVTATWRTNTFTFRITVSDSLPGDINGDGNVNNKDLTRLMKYLAGENVTVTEAALDVNGDGNVNNKDLTRLMKYLAGEDVELFIN